jgi:hypothetical protein
MLFAAGASVVGLALDTHWLPGLRLPTLTRQVNDAWLYSLKPWAYGLGFGVQLGAGVTTVVTSSAIYLAFLGSFLTASPWKGALIGGAFGMARGATFIFGGLVRKADDLTRMSSWIEDLERPIRTVLLVAQSLVLALVLLQA